MKKITLDEMTYFLLSHPLTGESISASYFRDVLIAVTSRKDNADLDEFLGVLRRVK